MKLNGVIITGKIMEEFREKYQIALRDFTWILGLYSATYTRMTTSARDQPLDHVHAGIIRYLEAYWPDIPAAKLFTDPAGNASVLQIEKLKEVYSTMAPLRLGGVVLDLAEHGALGALLFRSYSSSRHYELGNTRMTVAVEIWTKLVIHCFEKGWEKRIIKIITEEAKVHGIDPADLVPRGW